MRKNYRSFLFEEAEQDIDVPEGDLDVAGEPVARKADDSVDDQIDSLILMYEKESIRDDEDMTDNDSINESLIKLSLKTLLREQEEEATEEPAEEPAEEPPSPTGSEEMTAKAAKQQKVPDIDIDKFTIDIARLVMNYKQLLDVEKAIVNRTKNFLDENYGDVFVERFLDTLQEQFGISHKEFDVKYGSQDAPFAVGANPAGAGNVGGA